MDLLAISLLGFAISGRLLLAAGVVIVIVIAAAWFFLAGRGSKVR